MRTGDYVQVTGVGYLTGGRGVDGSGADGKIHIGKMGMGIRLVD